MGARENIDILSVRQTGMLPVFCNAKTTQDEFQRVTNPLGAQATSLCSDYVAGLVSF